MSTAALVAPTAPRTLVAPGTRAQGPTLTGLLVTQVVGGAGLAGALTVAGLIASDLGGTAAAGLSFAASVGGITTALPLAAAIRRWGRLRGLRLGWLGGVVGAGAVVAAALVGSLPVLLLGMYLLGGADTSGAVARVAATDVALSARRGPAAGLVLSVTLLTVIAGHALAAHIAAQAPRGGIVLLAGSFVASASVFLTAGRALSTALQWPPAVPVGHRHPTPALVATLVVAAAAVPLVAAGASVAALLSVAALKLGVGFSLAFGGLRVSSGHWSTAVADHGRRLAAFWRGERPAARVQACPVW